MSKYPPRTHQLRTTPQRLIELLKRRAIARYQLVPRPGRIEELESARDPNAGMSVTYGCRSIRVRFMEGRRWVWWVDFPASHLSATNIRTFREECDRHFGAVTT